MIHKNGGGTIEIPARSGIFIGHNAEQKRDPCINQDCSKGFPGVLQLCGHLSGDRADGNPRNIVKKIQL